MAQPPLVSKGEETIATHVNMGQDKKCIKTAAPTISQGAGGRGDREAAGDRMRSGFRKTRAETTGWPLLVKLCSTRPAEVGSM